MSDEFLDLRRRTICAERGAKRRALLRVELIGCVRVVADTAGRSRGSGSEFHTSRPRYSVNWKATSRNAPCAT